MASSGLTCQARASSSTASVPLDVANAHAARVQRQHLVVEALEPALVLAHQLRLERPRPISRDPNLDRPSLRLHPLVGVAVAAVALATALDGVSLEAQVLSQLSVQHSLHERGFEPMKQPLRTE